MGVSACVASFEDWNRAEARLSAGPGSSIGITLDRQVFIERGNIAAYHEQPMLQTTRLTLRLFWLGKTPLNLGDGLIVKVATGEYRARVNAIQGVLDLQTANLDAAAMVQTNEIAEIILEAEQPIPIDRYVPYMRTGRVVLLQGGEAVGGGLVTEAAPAESKRTLVPLGHAMSRSERERSNRHQGGVLWLTGLSGAGKSTLALGLEDCLFKRGMHAFTLDGDTIRSGLSKDLGFTPQDRSEHIRRVAEVAKLFAEAGHIAIVALISPAKPTARRPAQSLVWLCRDLCKGQFGDMRGA